MKSLTIASSSERRRTLASGLGSSKTLEILKVINIRKEILAEKQSRKASHRIHRSSHITCTYYTGRSISICSHGWGDIEISVPPIRRNRAPGHNYSTLRRTGERAAWEFTLSHNTQCVVLIRSLFELGYRMCRCFTGASIATQVNHHLLFHCSALAAEIILGPERICARTDGRLEIFLPQNGSFVARDRSFYEVALDVSFCRHYNK
jgi:hypothetical protein